MTPATWPLIHFFLEHELLTVWSALLVAQAVYDAIISSNYITLQCWMCRESFCRAAISTSLIKSRSKLTRCRLYRTLSTHSWMTKMSFLISSRTTSTGPVITQLMYRALQVSMLYRTLTNHPWFYTFWIRNWPLLVWILFEGLQVEEVFLFQVITHHSKFYFYFYFICVKIGEFIKKKLKIRKVRIVAWLYPRRAWISCLQICFCPLLSKIPLLPLPQKNK